MYNYKCSLFCFKESECVYIYKSKYTLGRNKSCPTSNIFYSKAATSRNNFFEAYLTAFSTLTHSQRKQYINVVLIINNLENNKIK